MSNGIGNKKQTTHKVALYTFSPEHKKNTLLTACGVGNRKSHWRYGQQKKNANNRQNQRHRSLRLRFSFFFFFFSHSLKPKRTKKKQSCATTTTDSTSHSRWYAARWNSAASTFPRGFLHRSADGSAAARSFRRGDDCAAVVTAPCSGRGRLPPRRHPLPHPLPHLTLDPAARDRHHNAKRSISRTQAAAKCPSATSTRTCAAFAFALSCLGNKSHVLRLSSPEPFILRRHAVRGV